MANLALDTAPSQEPCDSCAGSVRAMVELSSALAMAHGALQRIRVPLALGSSAAEDLQSRLRTGYQGVTASPASTIASGETEISDMSSLSGNWEAESASEPTGWSLSQANGSTSADQSATTTAAAENDERWYAITVGRDPGVFRGAHHIPSNISGIPGGSAQRFKTQELAQTAYDEVLDAGNVVHVSFIITRTVLVRS